MTDQNRKSERQLAAIMFADIKGYTSIMQRDEQKAARILRRFQESISKNVGKFNGSIVNEMGDGMLCTFKSSIDAVRCAMVLKEIFDEEPKVPVRIGVHSGTVVFDNDKVYGNSVNIASRIESLGVPGAVLFSTNIADDIKNQPDITLVSIGHVHFKNVEEPKEIFAISNEGFIVPTIAKNEEYFKTGPGINTRTWPIIGGLILIISIFAFWRLTNLRASPNKSIAVLPFQNVGQEEDNYFALGVTEDILTQISKIADLKVLSRFTLNDYEYEGKSPKKIGQELGIGYFLAGNIRRVGDDIRISCQLIDVKDETEEWSETFDRKLDNIFAVQSNIAFEVARQLKAELTGEEEKRINQSPTDNLIAYNLYLKGREEYFRYNAESNEKAILLFKEALILDDEFALAMAGLSDAYSQSVDRDQIRDYRYIDTALVLGETAVSLDPEIAEGWKALGLAHYFKNSLEEARQMFLNALEKNPNHAPSLANLALILAREGKTVEALETMIRVTELSPINPIVYSNIGQYYLKLELWDKAISNLQTSISLNIANWYPNYYKALAYILIGESEKSIENIQNIIAIDPNNAFMLEKAGELAHYFDNSLANEYFTQSLELDNFDTANQWIAPVGLAYILIEDGNIAQANLILDEALSIQLEAVEKGDIREERLFIISAAYALKDDKESAMHWLQQLKSTGYNSYLILKSSPWFSSLEGEELFKSIINDMKTDIKELQKRYQFKFSN